MSTERGEYRPIFTRLLNGPEFKALGPDARSCFYPVKLRLPAAGIGVLPGLEAILVEDTALRVDRVEGGITELESTGWLRRELTVVWLVRGLEFEPTLNPLNRQHREHIRNVVKALPTLSIVAEFRAHYAVWFQVETDRGEIEAPANGPAGAFEGHSQATRSTTPTPTTTPTPNPENIVGSSRARALVAQLPAEGGSALEGYLRTVHDPDRLCLEIESHLSGLHGPGGRPVTHEQLGRALHDMALAGAKMTSKTLAGFVRRVLEPEQPARTVDGDDTKARLDAWARRKEAERASARQ